jgi:hypothetical protein
MSRLTFDPIPEGNDAKWVERLRRVLEASFGSIRTVLDAAQGGIRMREQFRCIDTVIDMAALPVSVAVEGLKAPPLAVLVLRATEQRSSTGYVFTGIGVQWEWRGGAVLVHAIDGLAASTRYDATFAVME